MLDLKNRTCFASLLTYFAKLDYTIISLHQPWRHVVGKVKKGEREYFLKLATSQDISPKTRNEADWNTWQETLKKLPCAVPKVFEVGEYKQCFWYIAEYVDGKPLAEASSPEKDHSLNASLPLIAQTAQSIMQLPESEATVDLQAMLMQKINSWIPRITRDVSPLFAYIKKNLAYVQSAPMHGDFTPWHFLQSGNTIHLIDAESSLMRGFKYYDVAYFYHRVYTKLRRPDIAEQFLQEFITISPMNITERKCFSLLLAVRLTGGYLDAQSDTLTSVELQKELEYTLLQNKFV